MATSDHTEPPRSHARLGAIALLAIFNVVLSNSAQDALFLGVHSRERIPGAMFLGSVLTVGTSLLLSSLFRQYPAASILRFALVLLGIGSAGVTLWNIHATGVSTYATFLFVELATTIGTAATWTYFLAPLTPSQVRRWMPRLDVWAGVGGLLAGGMMPLLVRVSSPTLALGLASLSWGAMALLVRSDPVSSGDSRPRRRDRTIGGVGWRTLARSPVARWMMVGSAGVLWVAILIQYETRGA
jgi:hypothetical protein